MTDITLQANATLSAALVPTRSLSFYTMTASLPILVIAAVLLFTPLKGRWLTGLSVVGALVGILGLGRLLYDVTLDVAGFPDYQLPVWSVFYLIIYVVSAFCFIIFAVHTSSPGVYFGGIDSSNQSAFLDALYMSLIGYVGISDASFVAKERFSRFLGVGQAIVSMFINVVIITKFVTTF
jgi:hypothetical protein